MRENISNHTYDTRLYPSDWRFSAAIIGLIQYFNFHQIPFYKGENYIEYNQVDLDRDKYISFVDNYYEDELYHNKILKALTKESFDDEDIKNINKLIKANEVPTYLKSIIGKFKFDGNNSKELLDLIENDKKNIILKTYLNGKKMYSKYCNTNKDILCEDKNKKVCRLNGYYVDFGKKSKSISYKFDNTSFYDVNIKEFDFIPFSFTKVYQGLFINSNKSIDSLINVYNALNRKIKDKNGIGLKINSLNLLVESFKELESAEYFDVEIITKSISKDYYETIYITKDIIDIIKNANSIKSLYNFYIEDIDYNFFKIFEDITNMKRFDNLIIRLLKQTFSSTNLDFSYIKWLNSLIELNYLIYNTYNGGNKTKMKDSQKSAYAAGKNVSEILLSRNQKNKIKTYQQKLIVALSNNNADKIFEIITHISQFTGINIKFIYNLLEDYEENKNLVYTFIMAMNPEIKKDENKGE